MDRVIDHNYMMQALFGLQYILAFVQNNKDSVESEIQAHLKDHESYKYKNTQNLLTEVQKDIHTTLRKIQQYTKQEYFHYLCVLEFIKSGKVMLALKSLAFLKTNSQKSHYYIEALTVFSNYYHSNNAKVNDIFKALILDKFPSLKSAQDTNNEIKLIKQNYFADDSNSELLKSFLTLKDSVSSGKSDFQSFKQSVSNLKNLRKVPFMVNFILI